MKDEMDDIERWLNDYLTELAPHASYDGEDRRTYKRLEKLREDHVMRQVLQERLTRESEVIRAMQYRFSHHHPIRYFLVRKPWRKPTYWSSGTTLSAKIYNFVGWLRFAHDCADPAVGCSCHPSYRFPNLPENSGD